MEGRPAGRATPVGRGRALGRARGQPKTAVELAASLGAGVKPPGVPTGGAGVGGSKAPGEMPPSGRSRGTSGVREQQLPQGRGRAASVERPVGRGVSPVAGPGGQAGPGRATTRGITPTSTTGTEQVTDSLKDLSIKESGNGGSSSGNGNGDGSNKGRGGTRGKGGEIRKFVMQKDKDGNSMTKHGTSGTAIDVTSNYFKLVAKPDWALLQYRVDFKVKGQTCPVETRTAKYLVAQHKATLGNYIFDGSILFCCHRLCPDDKPLVVVSVPKYEETTYEVTIKLVSQVLPTDYHYLQFFNILLRCAMDTMKLELIRRNYFDPAAEVKFEKYKIALWPGYVTSIRQHENDVLLCCEVSTKVLRLDTVLDQIKEVHKGCRGDTSTFKSQVGKVLLGAIVITRYNNETYRIDEINWDVSPQSTFETKDGPKSYLQYYETKYNKKITDPKQPLIVSMPKRREMRQGQGPTGPVFLIPELCNMTGLSEQQRADFNLMKALGQHTRQDPVLRTETLKKFSKRLEECASSELGRWNLKFDRDLVKFKARVMKPVDILGKGSAKATYSVENADWGACFRKWNSFTVGVCSKWAVIYAPNDEKVTTEFVAAIAKVAPTLGMSSLAKPKNFKLASNRPADYIQKIDAVLAQEKDLNLIMVVVPNNKGEHYAAVKKKCVLEKPVPSQVVTATVLNKPKGLMSVATKVAVQMNCKVGGEPWATKIPLNDMMVVGYDTYHDTVNKGKSFGALVASLNQTCTKYMSVAAVQDTEVHQSIKANLVKCLREYFKLNKRLPGFLVMYRDGVGDGQIDYIVNTEIKEIEDGIAECVRSLYQDPGASKDFLDKFKFTFIIVSKRINTRFFKNGAKGPENPPSGSVFDDVVTLPERYDFFLISQSVRQGTVNPTSYNVVKDNSGQPAGVIQALTYRLTHLYYNWPGTVRVPAPCQYAHKLAFLLGETLHTVPKESGLEKTLYYL